MVYLLLRRTGAIGRFVHHQRRSTPIVEEVDTLPGSSASIGRQQTATEIWKETDCGAVVCSIGKDARDRDTDIGLSVIANDSSIYEESEQCHLIR